MEIGMNDIDSHINMLTSCLCKQVRDDYGPELHTLLDMKECNFAENDQYLAIRLVLTKNGRTIEEKEYSYKSDPKLYNVSDPKANRSVTMNQIFMSSLFEMSLRLGENSEIRKGIAKLNATQESIIWTSEPEHDRFGDTIFASTHEFSFEDESKLLLVHSQVAFKNHLLVRVQRIQTENDLRIQTTVGNFFLEAPNMNLRNVSEITLIRLARTLLRRINDEKKIDFNFKFDKVKIERVDGNVVELSTHDAKLLFYMKDIKNCTHKTERVPGKGSCRTVGLQWDYERFKTQHLDPDNNNKTIWKG
jgi:hypothetical protein